jgi:hypothetical protein
MGTFDSPFFVFAAVLILQWLAAYVGDFFRKGYDLSEKKNGTISMLYGPPR